ncbi:undecaprenyl/decaprenyl-phosphate alpha-N-acetylglucosaminyl 1-phosphate transferase [Belliella kenyensis]|uniref:Undecaprenyl/decaprenyl-phosphate alpha-N-acetylglucosaminyl 1-phosphate transferase n=1 Tax=Belliella kenyensis TaxID=1472724 RepID=A0ABV8EHF1_9BACT|nr:undecaprenyl/decaprenyl-phosphate alpha-N-acetylglucosaminyl 1-phosphate transferase [Belliella kenyensis]MCH7403846.1 undecaprenyl/decaprenyl-phosphate alpha-N-acetylglucosaminyl 1-phosphate transferase [Belliella kenyensis]MDN3603816.1 undecaprenyl/decaprenyl-phosphate alpha-N-acetylglucosaminyl 1-phosphate transferase [Belliella kenyensis]
MTIVLGFVATLILTWLAMPFLIRFLLEKGIGDIIDDRRMHIAFTPTAGGIGVMIPIFLTSVIGSILFSYEHILIPVVAVFLIAVTGVIDDLHDLKASRKLVLMILPAILLATLGVRVDSFYGLAGIYEIPLYLSYPLTVLIFVFLTNAFNLIDGVDGLLNVIASFVFLIFGVWFALANEFSYSFLSFCFLGGSVGFLIYNWSPAKIFMGDTGSLSIGFMVSFLAITFLKVNDGLPGASEFKIDSPVSFSIALLVFPIFDTFRVFVIRIWNRTSPFRADKRHLHHYLAVLGFNHRMISITALLFNSGLFFGIYAIDLLDDFSLVVLITGILFLSSFTMHVFRSSQVFSSKRRSIPNRELEVH